MPVFYDSGIYVGPTFNFAFFPRPYSLIKSPTFINSRNCFQALQMFSSCSTKLFSQVPTFILLGKVFWHYIFFLPNFLSLRLFFLPNVPGPTYVYSLPYVYSGVQSSCADSKKHVKILQISTFFHNPHRGEPASIMMSIQWTMICRRISLRRRRHSSGQKRTK